MPLFCNLFKDSLALLERHPQGDASVPVRLTAGAAGEATLQYLLPELEEALAALLDCPETSAALAALFLAGVSRGERAVRGGCSLPPLRGEFVVRLPASGEGVVGDGADEADGSVE